MQVQQGEATFRSTMFFSATFPPELQTLESKYLCCPTLIQIGEPGAAKKNVQQRVALLSSSQKRKALIRELKASRGLKVVFLNKKNEVEGLTKIISEAGFKAAALHGGKDHRAREKSLEDFRQHKTEVLVASDLAGRGIDVPGIELVVNFDCPHTVSDYVHRIGRTGRNGRYGRAFTLLTEADSRSFFWLREFIENSKQKCFELSNHPAAQTAPSDFGAVLD